MILDPQDPVRSLREQAGVSQYDLGRRLGKQRPQIQQWQRAGAGISIQRLSELASACGYEITGISVRRAK